MVAVYVNVFVLVVAAAVVVLRELGDSFVDALGDQVHVGGGETAHGDATVAQQVDVLLLHQELAHVRVQASEREHANLRRKIMYRDKI